MSLNVVNAFTKFASGGGGFETTAETNAMTVGGTSSAWVAISSVETWNGSVWSAGSSIPASRGLNSFRGNSDNGIMSGGFTSTSIGTAQNTTYVWNGSSWTTKANMNANRAVGFGMGGDSDTCFVNGGQDGSGGTQLKSSEEYDGAGNSWTTKTDSTNGGQGTNGAGHASDFIRCGGSNSDDEVETWNGSSWTELSSGSNFPASAYNYGTSCAVGKESFMFGTNSTSTGDNVIYKFDGSSWTNSGSATTAPKYIGMGGSSSYAIIVGAWASGTNSSVYNGSSWSTTNSLNTARATSGTDGTTAT